MGRDFLGSIEINKDGKTVCVPIDNNNKTHTQTFIEGSKLFGFNLNLREDENPLLVGIELSKKDIITLQCFNGNCIGYIPSIVETTQFDKLKKQMELLDIDTYTIVVGDFELSEEDISKEHMTDIVKQRIKSNISIVATGKK